MSKLLLKKGALLRYTGPHFHGFDPARPQMVFLGYDETGCVNLWADYNGATRTVSITEVEVIAPRMVANL